MGVSWSSRRRNSNYLQNPTPGYPHPQYLPSPYYYYLSEPPVLPPPPQNHLFFNSSANANHPPYHHNPYSAPPLPPPTNFQCYSGGYNCNFANYVGSRFNCHLHYANRMSGWPETQPHFGHPLPPPMLVPGGEHQRAKKVRSDVNVHKDTLRLELDQQNPDHHLVSFVFDALYDGSITILYFAKEEPNCRFVPVFPEAFMPVRIPFQKGPRQRFFQPPGTGIDLGFFEVDDLSKSSQGEDIFPLVVLAATYSNPQPMCEHGIESRQDVFPHMQVTQAILEKNTGDQFQAKVVRQLLWIGGVRYELHELFGVGRSSSEHFDDNNSGKDCVICMTTVKDTAVLPCRHLCMCSDCANTLRHESNKCPICRQPIEELLEIKVEFGYQ